MIVFICLTCLCRNPRFRPVSFHSLVK